VDAHDMATYGYQGHYAEDGTPWSQTIINTGYAWTALGQNVYAYCLSLYFCHAGLNVDWGVPSLDHRTNIMQLNANPPFQEIGVSIFHTSIPGFGPYVMAYNFGRGQAPITAIIGVTYADNNGDGTFTSGEGIGGTVVQFAGSAGNKYKVNALASGYYRADLPSDCYTVKFKSNGFSVATSGVCLAPGQVIQITARADPNGGNIGTNGIAGSCDVSDGSDGSDECEELPALYNYVYNGASDAAGQDIFAYPENAVMSNTTDIQSPNTNSSASLVHEGTTDSSGASAAFENEIVILVSYIISGLDVLFSFVF